MNRFKFLLHTLLFATIIISCTKDDSLFSDQGKIESRSAHEGHTHFGSEDFSQESIIGFEENDPFIKFIDHDIFSLIAPILPDKFSPKEVELLEQGYIWTYEAEGSAVYTIDFEYLEGSIKKVLVAIDSKGNIQSINILETFIGSLNNSLSLHDLEVDSIVIYPVDSDRFKKGKGDRNTTADCKNIVFGHTPGGTTVNNDPDGDGITVFSNPGGTFGDGTTYSSGGNLFIIICGCKPAHTGGKKSRDCKCRKSDRLLIVKKPDTVKDSGIDSEVRNDQEYWDCVEDLIGCQMLNDNDLAIHTLKHCHGVDSVNDVDNHAGNDGTNQFIGPEFCDDWKNYQTQCLNGSTSIQDVYQPWSGFMLDYPDLFFDVIEGLPECKSTDEMEDEICKINAFEDFVFNNNLILTPLESEAIKQGVVGCDDYENKAFAILVSVYMSEHPFAKTASDEFLGNYPSDQDAIEFRNMQILHMRDNPDYAEYIEASLGFSGVMWTIVKEVIGDKLIDLIGDALIGGQKQDILDAIKAAKNGDPFGVVYNAALVVGKKQPIRESNKGSSNIS